MSGPTSAGSTGKIDVDVSDQTTRPLVVKFNEVQNDTTLSIDAVKGAYTITVANTTGFVAGRYIILFNQDEKRFSFFHQVGAVAGNVITLDAPLDFSYPIGTYAVSTITNMNVDGSGTARVFGIRGAEVPPGVDVKIDITRIIFDCTGTSAMDLATFGNLTALVRGLLIRKRNDATENIFNVKTNAEIKGVMYDLEIFSASNPAKGVDGFSGRLTFAGQNKMGVAVRLDSGEDLEVLVQDDLQLLTTLSIVAEGHVVEDR